MKAIYLGIALIGLAAAGCGKGSKQEPAAGEHQGMAMDSGGMHGMAMGSSRMMPMMQAHTDSMMRMNPDQMSGMMASHERMMSQLMDQMGSEMRQMKMGDMPEWSALADSVRQDLAELPGLTGQRLQARMRAHGERVRRLLSAHERMMKGM